MNNRFIKKVVSVFLIGTCLFGFALAVNAASISGTYYFGSGGSLGYSTTTFTPWHSQVNAHVSALNLSGYSKNVWPAGMKIRTALFTNDSSKSRMSEYAVCSARNQVHIVTVNGSISTAYCMGAKNDKGHTGSVTTVWAY